MRESQHAGTVRYVASGGPKPVIRHFGYNLANCLTFRPDANSDPSSKATQWRLMATSFSPFDKLCHRHHLARHANYRSERISSRKRAFPQPCFVTSRQKEVTRHRKTSSLQLYDCGGEKPLLLKFVESERRSDAVQSKKTGAAKLPSLLPACTLPQVLFQTGVG